MCKSLELGRNFDRKVIGIGEEARGRGGGILIGKSLELGRKRKRLERVCVYTGDMHAYGF